jgi:hypothetical protein
MGSRLEQPQYQAQIAQNFQNPIVNPSASSSIQCLIGKFPLWLEKWGGPARWFYNEIRVKDCSDGLATGNEAFQASGSDHS